MRKLHRSSFGWRSVGVTGGGEVGVTDGRAGGVTVAGAVGVTDGKGGRPRPGTTVTHDPYLKENPTERAWFLRTLSSNHTVSDRNLHVALRNGVVFVVGGTQKPGADNLDYRWDRGVVIQGIREGSNSGSCVTAWAPAAPIWVATHRDAAGAISTTGYRSNVGTSFSAPLVAGIAARWMHERHDAGYARPWYTDAYDALLAANTAAPVPQNTATTGYPVCVIYGTGNWREPYSWELADGTCYYGDRWYSLQGASASTSKIIHWSRTCP